MIGVPGGLSRVRVKNLFQVSRPSPPVDPNSHIFQVINARVDAAGGPGRTPVEEFFSGLMARRPLEEGRENER